MNVLKKENTWQQEAIRNLTEIVENFQIGMTEENIAVKQHLERLDTECAITDAKYKDINDKLKIINTEISERKIESGKEVEQMSKVIDSLSAKKNKLELDSRALEQTIHEIQNDNKRMETELTKMHATLSSPTTATGIFGPHSCDKDWKSFNGHRYLAVFEKKIWNDASAFCESRQSYLIEATTRPGVNYIGK